MTARKTYRTGIGENEAEYCRKHRLFPGTRLIGDEGWGPTVIEITALGRRTLLATTVSHDGDTRCCNGESSWTLSLRDWNRVPRPSEPRP